MNINNNERSAQRWCWLCRRGRLRKQWRCCRRQGECVAEPRPNPARAPPHALLLSTYSCSRGYQGTLAIKSADKSYSKALRAGVRAARKIVMENLYIHTPSIHFGVRKWTGGRASIGLVPMTRLTNEILAAEVGRAEKIGILCSYSKGKF